MSMSLKRVGLLLLSALAIGCAPAEEEGSGETSGASTKKAEDYPDFCWDSMPCAVDAARTLRARGDISALDGTPPGQAGADLKWLKQKCNTAKPAPNDFEVDTVEAQYWTVSATKWKGDRALILTDVYNRRTGHVDFFIVYDEKGTELATLVWSYGNKRFLDSELQEQVGMRCFEPGAKTRPPAAK